MKRLIKFFFVATVVLTGCNTKEIKNETEILEQKLKPVDPKQEFAKLNEFLQKFEQPAQTFKSPTNRLIKAKGKQGIIISINPADLETENGQPVGKEVEITLKELSNRQQLLRANAQTVSDGQLLISGGACHISVTSDGQKVKLKEGKTYAVEFPKLSDDEMSLYYGQQDSSGKMNWKQAGKKFENPKTNADKKYEAIAVTGWRRKDTVKVEMKNYAREKYEKIQQDDAINDIGANDRIRRDSKINEKIYSPVALSQFGWINCDRLFKQDAPRTTIQFTISNKIEDVNYASVSLVFKEFKSLMQSSYYVYDNKMEGNTFDNVPVGMNVRILAVSYQHEKIFAVLTDARQVMENHNEKLSLSEMSETDFDKLMKSVE